GGAVGPEASEGDTPGQRPDDERAPVGGQHAAELVARLERGDHAIARQRDPSEPDEQPAAVFAKSKPDEVGAADLGYRGREEQRNRADRHTGILPGPRPFDAAPGVPGGWRR